MIRIDSAAWDEGFSAGEISGAWKIAIGASPHIPCPYPPGSIEGFSWCSGFIEGDAKAQGFSYSRGGRAK